MEPRTTIVLVSGALALGAGAPTCLCETSDAWPIGTKTSMNPDSYVAFC